MKTIFSLLIISLIAVTTYAQETTQKHYLQELIDKYKMMEPDSVVADMQALTKKCAQADFKKFENDILNSITKEDSLYIKQAFKDTINLKRKVKKILGSPSIRFYNDKDELVLAYMDLTKGSYKYRNFSIRKDEKLVYKLKWGLKGNYKKEETYYYHQKENNAKKLYIYWSGNGRDYSYQMRKLELFDNKTNRYSKKKFLIYKNRERNNIDRYNQSKPVVINQYTKAEYPIEFIRKPEILIYNTSMFLVSFNQAKELTGLDFFDYRNNCADKSE